MRARAAAVALALATGAAAPAATAAGGGFYAGVGLLGESAGVSYRKTVGTPASAMTAGDRDRDPLHALQAFAGYRVFLSDRFYAAAEIAGAAYANDRVTGFLRGTGDRWADVWPGGWTIRKRLAAGFDARLGYVPEGLAFLGAGRSLYLFAGMRRARADIYAEHLNERLEIASGRGARRTLAPRLAGAGAEFGGARGRFDLRLGYASGDTSFAFGTGAPDDPALGYTFDIREWRVSLAWVFPLGE